MNKLLMLFLLMVSLVAQADGVSKPYCHDCWVAAQEKQKNYENNAEQPVYTNEDSGNKKSVGNVQGNHGEGP